MQTQNATPTDSMPVSMAVDSNITEQIATTGTTIEDAVAEAKAAFGHELPNRTFYRNKVMALGKKSLENIRAMWDVILDAKINLSGAEYKKFISSDLPFSYPTICKLLKLAADHRINDPSNAKLLPASWNTLYEIMQLSEPVFRKAVDAGVIHHSCEWKDVKAFRNKIEPPTRKTTKKKTTITAAAANAPTGKADLRIRESKASTPVPEETPEKSAAASSTAAIEAQAPKVPELQKDPCKPEPTISAPAKAVAENRVVVFLTKEVKRQNFDQMSSLEFILGNLVAEFPFIEAFDVVVG